MGDHHPTEKMQLIELHGLGSWPLAIAALNAIGDEWLPLLKLGILHKMRMLAFDIETKVEAGLQPASLINDHTKLANALADLSRAPVELSIKSEPGP